MQIERQKVKNMEEENVETNYPEFKPLKSIGYFIFDSDIIQYSNILKNFSFEEMDKFGTEYYQSPDENLLIAVKNNKISAIFCDYELYYQSVNLIGLDLKTFKHIMQCDYAGKVDQIDMFDDGNISYIFEFEGIGAQVWVQNYEITTIIASGKESYSDEPYWD